MIKCKHAKGNWCQHPKMKQSGLLSIFPRLCVSLSQDIDEEDCELNDPKPQPTKFERTLL